MEVQANSAAIESLNPIRKAQDGPGEKLSHNDAERIATWPKSRSISEGTRLRATLS